MSPFRVFALKQALGSFLLLSCVPAYISTCTATALVRSAEATRSPDTNTCGTSLTITETHASTLIFTYLLTKSTFITTTCNPSPPICETPCGPGYCASDQYCYAIGECRATTAGQLPIRPTSTSFSNPFRPPVPTLTSSSRTGSFNPKPLGLVVQTSTTDGEVILVDSTTSEAR